jgi:hypothetical protein
MAADEVAPALTGRWPDLPEAVVVADEVDLDSPDPAAVDGGRRQCVSERQQGGRCTAPPLLTGLLCSAHAGKLDASAGGHALAKQRKEAREAAEERAALARSGVRAIAAEALREKATEIRLAIHSLADSAAGGDRQAALALIPWLNQALGLPTERVEMVQPRSSAEVAALSDEELAALVASGRVARLEDKRPRPE